MTEIREPQKANAREKKRKIIAAGLKAFSEKGYYNTTTAEIAKIAGVSTGIVYNYFTDKKDIFLQALQFYFQAVFAPMEEALEALKPPFELKETIRSLIQVTVQSHQNRREAHEEFIAMSHLDEDVANEFMAVEKQITDTLAVHLNAHGIDFPDLREKTHIAYHLVEDFAHECVYHRHPYIDYDKMLDETVRLLLKLFDAE